MPVLKATRDRGNETDQIPPFSPLSLFFKKILSFFSYSSPSFPTARRHPRQAPVTQHESRPPNRRQNHPDILLSLAESVAAATES